MSVLERKLLRDIRRLKGQVATISLVLACGIMTILTMRSSYHSLLAARDAYYSTYRFADVFARVKRAPSAVEERLTAIPGVMRVYTRIVENVMIPMPSQPDPIAGRIVSIPDDREPPLNALHVRAGRLPAGPNEAIVLESFVKAHELALGDRIPVVIEGRLREIAITGTALSPEYVLAMPEFEPMPDAKRFVVMWMTHDGVAPAFEMEGAFNDVVLQLEHGASERAVLDAVDRELQPYGGRHAVGRDKQISNMALQGELDGLRQLAVIIPVIFLAVAAFLVNVVISRLVFLERTQIAVLKAIGYADRRVALHYLGLIGLVVAIAAVIGVSLGIWSARGMVDLYTDFYHFPTRIYHMSPALIAGTLAIGFGSATIGALGAVRRVVRMPPAEAMRPPAPLVYRRSLAERAGLDRFLGPGAMIVVREIERRPLRFALSTCGIAMGVGIFLFGRFSWDSFDRIMTERFPREHGEELAVTLRQTRPANAAYDLAAIPGVVIAQSERVVPARAFAGPRSRDLVIQGVAPDGALHQILDANNEPMALPPQGALLTRALADKLGVRPGDELTVEILEGAWLERALPIAGLVDEPFGMQAYARADWLADWLHEEPSTNRVLLGVDPVDVPAVQARLKQMPEVIGVTSTKQLIDSFRAQTGKMMLVFTIILVLSASAISIGVVYNNARVALSQRGRDLATLRVLGFTRHEVGMILLGEIGLQIVLGIPLGLALGAWGSGVFAGQMQTEWMRLPSHLAATSYATAALIALLSGIASSLLIRRMVGRLDLIGVLKSE